MKLEVGMYVRTINGKIWIITSQKAISGHRKDIIKASHNIIDLIEVGDFIDRKQVVNAIHCKDGFNRIELFGGKAIMNKTPIKSIVTHEQFESMAYKLGDE